MKMSRWSDAATSLVVRACSIALPNTAADMPPLPTGVDGGLARCSLEQLLRHETARGADRDDDRVLDLLRLGEAEDFGTEILRPVRPADAAPRDLSEAQVQRFNAGRVNENLIARSR